VAEFLALDRDKQFAYQLDLKARIEIAKITGLGIEEIKGLK